MIKLWPLRNYARSYLSIISYPTRIWRKIVEIVELNKHALHYAKKHKESSDFYRILGEVPFRDNTETDDRHRL